jgi:hypothetical protein
MTLVSIQLTSNRPERFTRFLDRLEATARNAADIEVVVKIDDDDTAMTALLAREVPRRRLRLVYLSTPLSGGFYGLWRAMNDVWRVSDPNAYFVVNMNDEMWFATDGWDERLRRHIGLFPDHIFRLRTSANRHRAYTDVWECGFAPDNCAFTTRRWIEAGGDWTPCTGPETFQQSVAFYLARNLAGLATRDVPIDDIEVRGEGASREVADLRSLRLRQKGAIRQWFILMGARSQEEASRRAARLEAAIVAARERIASPEVRERIGCVELIDKDRVVWRRKYRLDRLRLALRNAWRATNFYYYAGNPELGRKPIRNTYLLLRLLLEGTSILAVYERLRPRLHGR